MFERLSFPLLWSVWWEKLGYAYKKKNIKLWHVTADFVNVSKKVKQSRYRPGVAQMVPGISPTKYSWYSFLLEAESTPGP